MKLNHRELSSLLTKNNAVCGWLFISVKDFTSSPDQSDDHFVRRWCCVQHNLLLTSKVERGVVESVIVLEGHAAKICHCNSHGYGFTVLYPDNSQYRLYCTSREVAVQWVQAISDSGVFHLKKQWAELQERYDSLVAQQNRLSRCFENNMPPSTDSIEVSLKATLPLNSPTNHTYASVYTQHNEDWHLTHQTESVDHTLTPCYTKTVQFNLNQDSLALDTQLRFCVNDISSVPAKILGTAKCTLSQIHSEHTAPLLDTFSVNVGSITITLHRPQHTKLQQLVDNNQYMTVCSTRTFVFDNLHVSEQMWDVDFSITFPLAYLNFLLEKKEDMLNSYEDFTTLDPIYDKVIEKLVHHYNRSMQNLLRSKQLLEGYTGPKYRKSVQKKDPGWEYVPVNLAIYVLGVWGEEERNYYTTTAGATSAHALGYKSSCYSSMKQCGRTNLYTAKHEEIMRHIDLLHVLWKEIEECKSSLIDAVALEHNDLYHMAVVLTTKISDLTEFCKLALVVMGEQMMKQAETQTWGTRERNWSSPEISYVWDGVRYRERCVSESTDDDSVETGVKLHITKFIHMVERRDKGVGKQLLYVLASLEPLVTSSHQGLAFLSLLEEQKIFYSYFEHNLEIETRVNQCYSQALTVFYTTFYMSVLNAVNTQDWAFFNQLDKVGYLIHFQSLLSTHGPELVMLEDYINSVAMLAHTTITFVTSEKLGTFQLLGSYHKVNIMFGVGQGMLSQHIKLGKQINIYPFIITQGVNEQQLYAEKFGTTSLQEEVNTEGLCNIEVYHSMYKQYIESSEISNTLQSSEKSNTLQTLDDLMCVFSQCVKNKLPKNVLMLATCHKIVTLMKGGRVTSCKSAKDRTAMAVTYDSVCKLQEDCGLDVRSSALSALRSHGVRPLNCKKNTGSSKYAFNSLQLKILPKEYRPPIGSYGGNVT